MFCLFQCVSYYFYVFIIPPYPFCFLCCFLMISVASAVLMEALINSNFSIEYVWGHSSRDMPLFYKITSFWGGLEGSLLFWILVQSFFIMIVAFRYQYTNREIIPYVLATLNGIMCFLLILLIGWSNPLELQAVIPEEGRGLKPDSDA